MHILNFAKQIYPIKTIDEQTNTEYKLCTQFLLLPHACVPYRVIFGLLDRMWIFMRALTFFLR